MEQYKLCDNFLLFGCVGSVPSDLPYRLTPHQPPAPLSGNRGRLCHRQEDFMLLLKILILTESSSATIAMMAPPSFGTFGFAAEH